MWPWGGSGGGGWAAVARMRRALMLLALGASCAALLLYWRQQTDDAARRHDHLRLSRYAGSDPQWTWTCRNQRCERDLATADTTLQSLPTCNMLCASTQLWPQPTGPVSLATAARPVSPSAFTLQIVAAPSYDVKQHLKAAFELFRADLTTLERSAGAPTASGSKTPVLVRVAVNGSSDPRLRLTTDESYEIALKSANNALVADIAARSFCGARHGFETLFQLVWFDPYAGSGSLLMLEAANVVDAPLFHYRGLLLDTARNFFPVRDIIRTIDAMAANKLNTFHWHATDSQSFPLMLASAPKLAERGAYSAEEIYTTDDVKEIVRHARLRGVRVLIEVDAPAHVGRAWSWGAEEGRGQLAQCVEAEPWSMYCGEPPCGQLNPRNENVYDVLEAVYREIIQLTGVDDVFHLGGDEVSEYCWHVHFNDTEPMDLWMEFTRKALARLVKANGGRRPPLTMLWSSRLTATPYLETLDKRFAVQVSEYCWHVHFNDAEPMELWMEFTRKALARLVKPNRGRRPSLTMLWSSRLTTTRYLETLDKRYAVQVWGASQWAESTAVLDAGRRAILSHVDAWYLDCGFGSWRDSSEGHCGPYRSWQQVYEHRPWLDYGAMRSLVMGAAVCQWTEQLDAGGADARMWPRAAAFAERLWSDPAEGATRDAYLRLDTQRARLVTRGVRAAPLWPRWCTHNPGACLS